MINIYFDKLYRYDRINEPCGLCIPVKKGELKDAAKLVIKKGDRVVTSQSKVTSRYDDGSVRYIYTRFLADIPGNKGAIYSCDLTGADKSELTRVDGIEGLNVSNEIWSVKPEDLDISITHNAGKYEVNTGAVSFGVSDNSQGIFDYVRDQYRSYEAGCFEGPYLKTGDGKSCRLSIDSWRVVEAGAVCVILEGKGTNKTDDNNYDFTVRLTAYAGKPWIDVAYRLFNTSNEELHVAALEFYAKPEAVRVIDGSLSPMNFEDKPDSTGCGDSLTDNSAAYGPIYHTRGIGELDMLDKKAPVNNVRTVVASSNYKTDFYIGRDGEEVNRVVDANYLIKEANEHFGEVFYGTFMADRTDDVSGICVTVFQAQQNFPKAVKANADGIAVMLVPEGVDRVVMQSGMAREQRFMLDFHSKEESLLELDNRSLIYQMPDRPCIEPAVFKESGATIDVYPEKLDDDVEIALITKGDSHSRCYGMLNWGDAIDNNYTRQGRGNGRPVWCNNEYDYPHSCALQYARTGIRRFLDYLIVSAGHWMDVDVCHYSDNPLRIGGQWEHTAGHCVNGLMVCSHEWVEGLLDYYHFTGDERGLTTALGIGDNVLRLLDTPMYAKPGEANARETGWALRTLVALYVETGDAKWDSKSEWILNSFKVWGEEYGEWLAPYTDNTTIRVGFMISVAVGSVMRYYRVNPREDLKKMILDAVDDLIDNCLLPQGLFYYKELPSLQRLGNNTLLLESLTIAYELTNDKKYLVPGVKTFTKALGQLGGTAIGAKTKLEDAVVTAGDGTKGFAQSFIPLVTYYKAASEAGVL